MILPLHSSQRLQVLALTRIPFPHKLLLLRLTVYTSIWQGALVILNHSYLAHGTTCQGSEGKSTNSSGSVRFARTTRKIQASIWNGWTCKEHSEAGARGGSELHRSAHFLLSPLLGPSPHHLVHSLRVKLSLTCIAAHVEEQSANHSEGEKLCRWCTRFFLHSLFSMGPVEIHV